MKIVGIIPSRYNSQRLPAKPLADINGKPMVQHVYERARRSRLLTDVLVATDDARIESVVKKFGGSAIMTPADIQSGSDRIAYAAKSLAADIIVNVQGDEPLLAPEMIDEAIRLLIDDDTAQVGTAVKRIADESDLTNPNIVKAVLDHKKFALYFSRSPIPHVRDVSGGWLRHATFYKHFGIYTYRNEVLQRYTMLKPTMLEQVEKLEQLRLLENGYRIKCAVTEYDSIPVDTQEDLEKVRSVLRSGPL